MRRGIIAGIDIGTTKTTTVVARPEKSRKLRIVGIGTSPSAGLRRGAVVDAEAAAGSLRRSLAEASRSSGVTVRSAVVAAAGAHLATFSTRGAVAVSRADGEITDDDVQRVVAAAEGLIPKHPNREVVHLIPREFKVDGEGGIADPVGLVGMKLEVEALVVDGAKPSLANLIKCCELAGVEIDDWVAPMLAAATVLLTPRQRELGVMLLDLGAGTSDFAIFEEGRLLDAGSFPIGGGHLTSDIAIGLRTQVAVAEALKVRHASVAGDGASGKRDMIRLADFSAGSREECSTRDLANIVGARLTDIFELATKAAKRVGRAGLLPGGVVLTGGGADIPGIGELARRELRLPTEIAKAAATDLFIDVVPPRLAIPAGLIAWRIEQGQGALSRARPWRGVADATLRMLRVFIP